MPRLNVEAAVRSYLEGALQDVEVRVRVPEPMPRPFVLVRRSGGRKLDRLRDRPGVEVLMWDDTEAKVSELAERVGDAMEALNGDDGFRLGFARVDEESMRSDPDVRLEPPVPRWYASYTVTTYKYKEA